MTETIIPFIVPLIFSTNSSKGLKCLIQPYYFFKSKISGKFDLWSWKT